MRLQFAYIFAICLCVCSLAMCTFGVIAFYEHSGVAKITLFDDGDDGNSRQKSNYVYVCAYASSVSTHSD